MKRLTAQCGITYFTVLSIAFYIHDIAVIILGATAFASFIVFMMIAKIRKTVFVPAMALAVAVACAVNIGYTSFYVEPIADKYSESEHEIKAVLRDESYDAYKKHYYKLSAYEIDGESANVNILLKTSNQVDLNVDDKLYFTSELEKPNNSYYPSKGYHLIAYAYELDCKVERAESHTPYFFAVQLRGYLRRALDELLSKRSAALCKAVFIGDKYALELSDRENFRYAGASYFIVVSGMHFSVLTFLLYSFLRLLRRRWLSFVIITLFILLYAAVTGFQSSVLRSGIMVFFTILANTVRRQPYPLNHLGLAGIIMPFIVSPYGAGDIGLVLSFNATLAILLWAGPIAEKISFKDGYGNIYGFEFLSVLSKKKPDAAKAAAPERVRFLALKKLYNLAAGMLSVSLAANTLVFPITVFVFREFSLVTLISSFLLWFPIYLILILSPAVCLFFWLGPLSVVAAVLSYPLRAVSWLVLTVVDFLAGLPFSFVRVNSAYIYIWVAVTVLLGALAILFRRKYKLARYAVLLSVIVFTAGWIINTVIELNTLALEVYSCGDGLSVAVNDKGSLHLLSFDCRSKQAYDIAEKLEYSYPSVRTVFCKSSAELERCDKYIGDRFAICDYLLYDKSGNSENYADNIHIFDSDTSFILDDDLTLTVSVRSGRPVCAVHTPDKDVLIIPKKYDIKYIPENMRSPDVIVVTDLIEGAEQLSCTDLIISASEDKIPLIEKGTAQSRENIYTTLDGDISYNLR